MKTFITDTEIETINNLPASEKDVAIHQLTQDFAKYIMAVSNNSELTETEKLDHIKSTALYLKDKLGLDM